MNVLITGASKGIGYALAQEFTRRGHVHLYLVSRSEERLAQLKKACLTIHPGTEVDSVVWDLNKLQAEDLPDILKNRHFDIIINNAGFLLNKEFGKISFEEMRQTFLTNFFVPALLIQTLLPFLDAKSPAHIVNIGSMGGFQGSDKFPGLSIYSASKAALASLTECLAAELKGTNVYVNCLALGAVQTEMLEEAFPGYKAPLSANEMADFIADFALKGYKTFNGKVLPVSLSTP